MFLILVPFANPDLLDLKKFSSLNSSYISDSRKFQILAKCPLTFIKSSIPYDSQQRKDCTLTLVRLRSSIFVNFPTRKTITVAVQLFLQDVRVDSEN